jgi:hypothetical protein
MSFRIVAATVLASLLVGCSGDSNPGADEVEHALKSYLLAEKAKTCGGRVELERLRVIEVGEFDKQWGGWPAYATFTLTCYDGGNRTTWNSNDGSKKVITAFVRKTASGEYECFIPDTFREAQEQLKKQMDKTLKK